MRTMTLTIHDDRSFATRAYEVAARSKRDLTMRAAAIVRTVAAVRGISPLAVDYDVSFA